MSSTYQPGSDAVSHTLEHLAARASTALTDLVASQRQRLDAIEKLAADEHRYDRIRDVVREGSLQAQAWQAALKDLGERVDALDSERLRRNEFGVERWPAQRAELLRLLESDQARGVEAWMSKFGDALVQWELEACERIASDSGLAERIPGDVRQILAYGARALRTAEYRETRAMLAFLDTRASGPSAASDATRQAVLKVIRGRVELIDHDSPIAAADLFREAIRLAPAFGLSHAALATCVRVQGDVAGATGHARIAAELSPAEPDGYVELGLCAEDAGRWEDADRSFDRAARTVLFRSDPATALRARRGPTSGRLWVRLAMALQRDRAYTGAVAAIKQALEEGIKGPTGTYNGDAYELQAAVLKELGANPAEQAKALYEAGRRRYWERNYNAASEHFRRSIELSPTNASACFLLADSLMLQSLERREWPFVHEQLIADAVATWREGYEHHVPGHEDSWMFVSRALMNRFRVWVPGADLRSLRWEGAAYLERSLVHDEDIRRWNYLADFHAALNNYGVAFEAIDRAFSLALGEGSIADVPLALQTVERNEDAARTNVGVLDKWAEALVDFGFIDDALRVVEARARLAPDAWLDRVRAYVLFCRGQHAAAIKLLTAEIERSPEDLWALQMRGHCQTLMGATQRANEDYARIVEVGRKRGGRDSENRLYYAGALQRIGETEQALDLLREGERDLSESQADVLRNLAVIHITRGDLDKAQRAFDESTDLAIVPGELGFLLAFGIPWLRMEARSWAHKEAALDLLDGIERRTRERHLTLMRMPTAEEDFLRHQATPMAGAIPMAVRAGLARSYALRGRWDDAAALYEALLRDDNLREWLVGVERVIGGLRTAGDERMRNADFGGARALYAQALIIAERLLDASGGSDAWINSRIEFDNRQAIADLHARLCYAHFILADLDEAEDHLRRALEQREEFDAYDPAWLIAYAWASVLQDARHYWALRAWSDSLGVGLIDMTGPLLDQLEKMYKLSEDTALPSGTTPVVLDVHPALLPPGPEPEWTITKHDIPAMLDRIMRETGVRIPDVHVSWNDPIPGHYTIMIDEAQVASGVIDDTVAPSDDARRDGLILRAFPHLETVLRANLVQFLSVADVEARLREWAMERDGNTLIREALPDDDHRQRFIRAIRDLVREGVPIISWQEILSAFRAASNSEAPILQTVRVALKRSLPGNQPGDQLIDVPPTVESVLERGLVRQDGKIFVAMPPEETLEVLNTLRPLMPQKQGRKPVLVTRNPELRPSLQRLVALEFGDVAVIAQSERSDGAAAR